MKSLTGRLAASLQGLSGESIAILIAVGVALGTFPVYGGSTVLCLLAALAFRLHAPGLQLISQLTIPLQLALVFPFARLGEKLLGRHAAAPAGLLSHFRAFTVQALAGWLCLALPLGLLLYIVLSVALRRRRPASFEALENPA